MKEPWDFNLFAFVISNTKAVGFVVCKYIRLDYLNLNLVNRSIESFWVAKKKHVIANITDSFCWLNLLHSLWDSNIVSLNILINSWQSQFPYDYGSLESKEQILCNFVL